MPWFIIDTREHFSTHLISTHIPNFGRVGEEKVMKLYNMMVSSLPNAIHVHISPFKVHTDGVIFFYLGKILVVFFFPTISATHQNGNEFSVPSLCMFYKIL